MNRIHLLVTILASVLAAADVSARSQTAGRDSFPSPRTQRALTERLRWEILWSREGIQAPSHGSARLAIYLTDKMLVYCSHDLGRCAQYEMSANLLGQPVKSVVCGSDNSPCKNGQEDEETLMAFVRQIDAALPILWFPEAMHQQPKLGGGLSGLGPLGAMMGIMTTQLGTKAEIVTHYMQLRPAKLQSLKTYLATIRNGRYRSITIPCFAESDPEVRLFAERIRESPIIISVYWNSESEEWDEAGTLGLLGVRTSSEEQEIARIRSIIESIKCDTVTFE